PRRPDRRKKRSSNRAGRSVYPQQNRTDDAARTQTKISERKAELQKSEAKRDVLKTEIKQLEDTKTKLAGQAGGAQPGAGTSAEVAELEKRINARSAELKAQEEAIAKQKEIISSLQGSLDALDKG